MGTVVLDASVLLAAFDPQDSLHAATVPRLRRHRAAGDRFVVPASVLAEVLVGAARRGEQELQLRRRQVQDAFGRVHALDEDVAAAAARWRARHAGLGLPDALVLATGDVVAADVVLTADRRWRRLDSRVRVLAPAQR